MTSNVLATSFNGTCVPIKYPCNTGNRYIDPCDCTFYYLCRDSASIIRQPCALGTAYDHTSGKTSYCTRQQDVVFGGICDQTEPWTRCQDVHQDADKDSLKRWCTGTGYFTPSPQKGGGGDDANTGAIVGAVIAILLIIVIVVLVVIYVRRKGNPIPHIKQTQFWRQVVLREGGGNDRSNVSSVQSTPRYGDTPSSFQHGDEETYTEIDDTAMYKDSTARQKSSLRERNSHSNETYDREDEEEDEGGVAYDNPALQRDTPPPDTELSPAPPAYSSLDDKGESAYSYSSLNEHHRARELNETDGAVNGSVPPAIGEDGYLMAEPIGQSLQRSGRSPVDPAYFELEGQEHAGDNSFEV